MNDFDPTHDYIAERVDAIAENERLQRRERELAKLGETARRVYENGEHEGPRKRRWVRRGPLLTVLCALHLLDPHGIAARDAVRSGVFAGRRDDWTVPGFRITLARSGNGGWLEPR